MSRHPSSIASDPQCALVSAYACSSCSVLENISEGVLVIDLQKKIHTFNRAAEEATRFTREEALGQYCFDMLRTSICAGNCVMEDCISDESSRRGIPAFIINKAGDQIPISISASLIKDAKGRPMGIIETFRDLTEIEKLRRHINRSFTSEDIIGKHPRMREIFAFLPDIAESQSPVLIEGPTGSGKELFARALHHLSSRREGPFIAINCGALPETLLESELFGYTKGAFTGATKNKAGRLLLADKGTLFLDEICNTSMAFQADLLRVLEQREFIPLGDTRPVKTDFRVIAAANRNLKEMMAEGVFREDLYYRLNVVKIHLPPLTERREDIPLLLDHFVRKYNILKGRHIQGVSSDVLACLMKYPFPGNIRELENIVEYAYILCKTKHIELEHLPAEVKAWNSAPDLRSTLSPLGRGEAEKIMHVLATHHGNRTESARELGISRSTLWRKIKKYGLA